MGILPIGFFSPLPLAMMIPFMATQSLAMGEAFGKSFQYGKRKISSMTNEEFNKLTFHDLMVEQTANIKAIIPELKQQMSMSKDMQEAIFREMVELIPAFFNSLRPKVETDDTTNTSASPPPPITQIRYAGRTDQDLAQTQARLDAANKLFYENFLKQQGTKESLAAKLEAQNPPPLLPEKLTSHHLPPSAKVLSASTDPVYIAWITKLGDLKSSYRTKTNYIKAMDAKILQGGTTGIKAKAWKATAVAARRQIVTKIRAMSRDYRNPNNHIRENALRLRAEMSRFT